jgi:hypothetical protein
MALATKQKLVSLSQLKFAPWNPTNRTEEDNPALKRLADSMSKIGLIYPILVTPDNEVIDGHRRATAAKMLDWKDVQAIVTDSDRESTYAAVNDTAQKMTGHDALGVWLKNPRAVGVRQATWCQQMTESLGRELVVKFYQEGLGPQAYLVAKQIAKYCGDESGDLVVQAAKWMLHTKQVGQVRKLMTAGCSPKVLLKAVRDMKPLRIEAAVG